MDLLDGIWPRNNPHGFIRGAIYQTSYGHAKVTSVSAGGLANFTIVAPSDEAKAMGWKKGATFVAHPEDNTSPSPRSWMIIESPYCIASHCGKKAKAGKSMCDEHLKTHPLRPRPDLRNNPHGKKHKATRIELDRAEGPSYDLGWKTAKSWVEAQKIINAWARTAPKNGGYDKVDFKISFDDSQFYEGRLDIKHPSVADDNNLVQHVIRHLEYGKLDPEYATFLRDYQIGDAGTRNNPRKPGKYPGFVIQTILVPMKYDSTKAREIAARHGARPVAPKAEGNFWHFRQRDPKLMTRKYITLKLPHATIVKALPKSTAQSAKIADTNKKLTVAERKRLLALRSNPSAFAYVDKKGGEHLPIHDKSHVRNAISRWNQTNFESKEKKEAARKKIVAAAKRCGIKVSPNDRIAKK